MSFAIFVMCVGNVIYMSGYVSDVNICSPKVQIRVHMQYYFTICCI